MIKLRVQKLIFTCMVNWFLIRIPRQLGFPGGASGKEPTCKARNIIRCRFNLESGRSPGGGHGSPLQYYCLENPTDRGAWQATVYRATESQT